MIGERPCIATPAAPRDVALKPGLVALDGGEGVTVGAVDDGSVQNEWKVV